MIEIFLVGILVFLILTVNGKISTNKFIKDNTEMLLKLKEDDWDFLVKARYGEGVNPNILFEKRVQNGLLIFVILFGMFLSNITFTNIIVCIIGAYVIFKSGYSNLKTYHRKHLHEINMLLPYYLKSLEILIQHYTVPVAITKSIDDAPDIFREGLKDLIAAIDSGDSSIEPYMEFAKKYPVRDSMRMMRLLYRLGLGNQERKQDQLIVFARTISNLQAKSRETKYKERLERMEKKTMIMLSSTAVGVMIILILSLLQMFSF